jgi:hypothetical protein
MIGLNQCCTYNGVLRTHRGRLEDTRVAEQITGQALKRVQDSRDPRSYNPILEADRIDST